MTSQVGKALLEAAGPSLKTECDGIVQKNGPVAYGSVTTTSGYSLKSKHVLHVVLQTYKSSESEKCKRVNEIIVLDNDQIYLLL